MGETLNMMERFIKYMVSEISHMDAPTVVKDNNETTTVSKLGKENLSLYMKTTMVL